MNENLLIILMHFSFMFILYLIFKIITLQKTKKINKK